MTNLSEQYQKDTFLRNEGDSWYRRNHGHAIPEERINVMAELARKLPGEGTLNVLEIGCSSGANLSELAQHRSIIGSGIDPSGAAVRDGIAQSGGQLLLQRGTADQLVFPDDLFDVVLFGFCLYLVDRALVFRAVAEADRVLKTNGILAIVDFDPALPSVRKYKHFDGLNSYKLDYSRYFLADPSYKLIHKVSWHHELGEYGIYDSDEQVALWVCKKDRMFGNQRV